MPMCSANWVPSSRPARDCYHWQTEMTMRSLSMSLAHIAFCALALGLTGTVFAQQGQAPDLRTVAANHTPTAESPVENVEAAELPDSPGTSWARAQETPAQQAGSTQAQATSSIPAVPSQTPADQDQSQKPQRPVGTAVAETPTVSGVTAAQPAGVAIAPAKQRRVRTLVLKVGAIVGAGVALGTAIALTEGTSSKPPGAH
jgi:hypothetical protein